MAEIRISFNWRIVCLGAVALAAVLVLSWHLHTVQVRRQKELDVCAAREKFMHDYTKVLGIVGDLGTVVYQPILFEIQDAKTRDAIRSLDQTVTLPGQTSVVTYEKEKLSVYEGCHRRAQAVDTWDKCAAELNGIEDLETASFTALNDSNVPCYDKLDSAGR